MSETQATCPRCGPIRETYRDEGDHPHARYCARCGTPIRWPHELPYSEVCMHLRVAGRRMLVERVGTWSVQLYDDQGEPFSFPVTTSEAGVR